MSPPPAEGIPPQRDRAGVSGEESAFLVGGDTAGGERSGASTAAEEKPGSDIDGHASGGSCSTRPAPRGARELTLALEIAQGPVADEVDVAAFEHGPEVAVGDHQVEVIASMPCYLEKNVEAQRGKGVGSRLGR